MHDYFLTCPTGLKYLPHKRQVCTLKPLSLACLGAQCDPRTPVHKGIRVLRTLAARRALAGYPFTAIHVSEIGRRTIGKYLPGDAHQVVLENPVQCEDRGIRDASAATKIAYCGRLTEDKGADLVAQAARNLGIPSLFVGDGPLRERILSIDPQAEITGWLDKDAVRAKLARDALVVVAPSLWPETGPLVIAEAMANGIPVIVSARAGAAGRVAHGENGLIAEPDVDSLQAAITALGDAGRAKSMGANAYRSYWNDPPGLRRHAEKLTGIYADALERGIPD